MLKQLWTVYDELEQAQDEAAIWEIVTEFVAGFGVASLVYRIVSPSRTPENSENDIVEIAITPDGADHFNVMNFAVEKEYIQPGFNLNKLLYWKNTFVLPHIYENDNTLEDNFSIDTTLAGIVFSATADANRKAIFTMAFCDATRIYSQAEFYSLRIVGEKAHQVLSDLYFQERRQTIQLSMREKEILQKIVNGKSNNQIAEETILSRHTVDAYIRRIFLKLNVSDRTSAAVMAIDNNLFAGQNYCSDSRLAIKRLRAS